MTVEDKELEIYKQQAQVLKALSHEARLRIIARLGNGEVSVGEIAKTLGLDSSTVSKHLSILMAQGIVSDRREKNFIYYSLAMPCVLSFFWCASQVIKDRKEK